MREGIREGVRWVGRAGMGGFAVFLSSLIQGVRLGGHSLSTQFHLSSFIFICMFPPCASISFLLGASCCLVRDVWTLYFARSSYFLFPFSLSKHHPMLFSFSSTPFISFASLNPPPRAPCYSQRFLSLGLIHVCSSRVVGPRHPL